MKPAAESNQSDANASRTFRIPKNTAPVSTVHSALSDQTSNPATNPLTEPATSGKPAKGRSNENNNNDDDETARRNKGSSKEAKERIVEEQRPQSDSTDQPPTPATGTVPVRYSILGQSSIALTCNETYLKH